MLVFEDELMGVDDDKEISSSSNNLKLVPWLTWDEWHFVRDYLFSSSSEKVASALERISTWRTRGCLPVVIDVTASIIEIQQKDPYHNFTKEENGTGVVLHSHQLLAMLYCMAIMRLVNCVVEKTRRKTESSISEAANAIGIPRKLIDVRHEGSHRDLPALQVVRDCSEKALAWLKAYYWEPQKSQSPSQRDGIQSEIKTMLHELVVCLKMKQNPQLSSSLMKGSRYKNKWTKCLKNLMKLYSTFSSEIVSVLLEFVLNAFDSSNLEFPNDSHVKEMSLDDWKPVISRFSSKEPELLISLLKEVLHMFETEEIKKCETGGQSLTSSENRIRTRQMEHLSGLFAWLVGLLVGLKHTCKTDSSAEFKVSSGNISKTALVELLRKCLFLSATGNKLLVDSSLHLAKLIGNYSTVEKLKKLSLIGSSQIDASEANSGLTRCHNLFIQQDDSILEAAKKLEFVKHHSTKQKVVMAADGEVGNGNRWVVAESWRSCPIGMLPSALGSSGSLPYLDYDIRQLSGFAPAETNEIMQLNQYSGKREAGSDIQLSGNSSIKKMKKSREGCQVNTESVSLLEASKGHLMIGGIWKNVGEKELQTIKSGVRILI